MPLAYRSDKAAIRCFQYRKVCNKLVQIVSIDIRYLIIAAEPFVFRIENNIIFVEVWIPDSAFVFKQIDSTFFLSVLRMDVSFFFENCIQILFPKPCSVEEYAAYFIIAVSILDFFHFENLQTKTLQRSVFRVVWLALLPQVFADNVTAFLFVVRGGVPDNRVYVVDCFPVDVEYGVPVFLCLHELDCMTNKFRHIIVRHIFSGGVGDLTHERGIEPKMPVKVDRAFYIGVIVPDGSIPDARRSSKNTGT